MGHKDFLPIEHDRVTIPPQQVARDEIERRLRGGRPRGLVVHCDLAGILRRADLGAPGDKRTRQDQSGNREKNDKAHHAAAAPRIQWRFGVVFQAHVHSVVSHAL